MSALGPAPPSPGSILCPRCGHVLREEQAWCLDCGLAARTRIHPPPNWRLPIAATLVLLTLLAAGIAFTLVALLDKREPAPVATTVTVPATAPGVTPPPATTPTTTVPTTTTPTVTTPTTTVPTTTTPGTATTPGGGTSTAPGGASAPD